MVKIRLRRIGTKGRPFYRVVVAKSTAGRNGAFVETIGSYDPVAVPKKLDINEARAIHWLMEGAQPTETTAYLLNKLGILPKFFEARPEAKTSYKFLDKNKRVAAIAKAAPVKEKAPAAEAAPAPAPEVVAAPEIESVPVEEPTPVVEEAPAEEMAVIADPEPEVAEAAAEEAVTEGEPA